MSSTCIARWRGECGDTRRRRSRLQLVYMLLCWNLMSRAANVAQSCFEHMDWKDDALTILLCTTKTDQSGDRTHPRHFYANPFQPEICPLRTSLQKRTSVCFAVEFSKSTKTWIGRISQLWWNGGSILRRGGRPRSENVPRHSVVLDPLLAHISAVCSRTGWKQPRVQDTYLVYADAGDQLVGRVVCGLPLKSVNFAILPPMFTHTRTLSRMLCVERSTFVSRRRKGAVARADVLLRVDCVPHRKWLTKPPRIKQDLEHGAVPRR